MIRFNTSLLAVLTCVLFTSNAASALGTSDAELARIGERIFANECTGRAECLTSWNEGEDFASMGIGHFIWYPPGRRGPFAESFPALVTFMRRQGIALPAWLDQEHPELPWDSRAEFLAAARTTKMIELNRFLASTKTVQAQFMAMRMESSLPRILAQANVARHDRLRRHFEMVAQSADGIYALIDYVNFKGEGVLASERYSGQGWGLLQVLEEMRDPPSAGLAVAEFAAAADRVLKRRVSNAPPDRHEERWLAGWLKRVRGYVD